MYLATVFLSTRKPSFASSIAIRRRLDAAHVSLEHAAAHWQELQEKRRRDWKAYRSHLADARRHWREALRLMAQIPGEAA